MNQIIISNCIYKNKIAMKSNSNNIFLVAGCLLILSGFLFKIIIAILDTPILYFIVYLFKTRFNLTMGEEIKLIE